MLISVPHVVLADGIFGAGGACVGVVFAKEGLAAAAEDGDEAGGALHHLPLPLPLPTCRRSAAALAEEAVVAWVWDWAQSGPIRTGG